MKTLDLTATNVVAQPKPVLDLGAVVKAPAHEPAITHFPGWLRVAVLFGGGAALWAAIGWGVMRLLKLA